MFWQINLRHNASCRNCWRELSLHWFCGLNLQKIPLSNRTIKFNLSIGFSLGAGQVVLLAKHLSNKHKDPNSTSESTLKTLLMLRRGDKWIPRTCRLAKLNESANSKSVRKSVSRNEMDNSWGTMLTSGLHTHKRTYTHLYTCDYITDIQNILIKQLNSNFEWTRKTRLLEAWGKGTSWKSFGLQSPVPSRGQECPVVACILPEA